eukprot:1800888-Lingulodinium_polyedra.AAC.1
MDELWMRPAGLPGIAEAAGPKERASYTPKTEMGATLPQGSQWRQWPPPDHQWASTSPTGSS